MSSYQEKSLPDFRDHCGARRVLGSIPSRPALKALVGAWDRELIPQAEWTEFDEWPNSVKVKDQGNFGACNGHATASGGELVRYVAGMPHVDLSAWGVYAVLCNGFDRGSSIMDAFALIKDRGVPPDSTVPYGTINPRKIAASAWEQAKRFRMELGVRVTAQQQIMTAVQRREPLNLSICVGAGFDDLDAEGIARLGTGTDNHAVTIYGGAKRAKNGRWIVKMLNSWSPRWGLKGFCWLYLDSLARSRYFECYGLSSFVLDPTAPFVPLPR